tara:strand:- start:67 stop:495 length:429 start_codon:yes stop_codon:yes gene_type:complete
MNFLFFSYIINSFINPTFENITTYYPKLNSNVYIPEPIIKNQEITTNVFHKITTNVFHEITTNVFHEITASVSHEITASVSKEITASVSHEITTSVYQEITASVSQEITASVSQEITIYINDFHRFNNNKFVYFYIFIFYFN